MKISYLVSQTCREAYTTSVAMQTSPGENSRKIRAEDFEWDEYVTPAPLSYFAALALSRIFNRINPLHKILQKDVDILMDLYPADIPLKFTVPHIKDEQYWKRSYATKFPSKKEIGVTFWKGKYLSACLQDFLENANPDVFIEEDAVDLATLVSPYIYELTLNQLRMLRQPTPPIPDEHVVEDSCPFSVPKLYDHIPLEPVLVKLYNLREISLVFCLNDLQDNYLPRYFEFSMGDCESLCRGLEDLRHLQTFRINRSNLDCSKVKLILQNLVKKESIEELDFNHCKIGDYGMKALGGFIFIHNNVKRVRIANNRFKEVGVQGIAYALQTKPAAPIEFLDFSLNTMSLECATTFASAFVRCKEKPQTLIVNSCGFHGASAEKIELRDMYITYALSYIPDRIAIDVISSPTIRRACFHRKGGEPIAIFSTNSKPRELVPRTDKMAGLLSLNRGLTRLDMAANDLSGEAEKTLIRAMEQNKKILRIDLRRTHISVETQAKVDELLDRNQNLLGQERDPSDEIPPLYLNEPEYLIWEYNPNNPDCIPGRYPVRMPEV